MLEGWGRGVGREAHLLRSSQWRRWSSRRGPEKKQIPKSRANVLETM